MAGIDYIDDQLYLWGRCVRGSINLDVKTLSYSPIIRGRSINRQWPEIVDQLESVIVLLSPRDRRMITLRYYHQLPVMQIIKKLRCGTEKYYRMLTELHQRIERNL